ncbi:MAG: MarR family winged helix-turn-helix transcriptional regulator [Candidatus Acidiferrales bacterium]
MSSKPSRPSSAAFLLAQLGAHVAKQFAERLSPLNLVPAYAGILRMLNLSSGLSQRELATRLGMHASRLVGIVDEMESFGLVLREGNAEDRRTYSLQITLKGREIVAQIGKIAREHNDTVCAALSVEERETLAGLLQRIADEQGLTRGVHPGFSRLGGNAAGTVTSGKVETKEL